MRTQSKQAHPYTEREQLASAGVPATKSREGVGGTPGSLSNCPHPVVLWVVLDLGFAQSLHQGRDVHAEAAAQALLQPVPTANRVLRRTAPRFNRAFGRRLLLVRASQRHPVAVLLEHCMQIVEAAEVVQEDRLSHGAHERRWFQRLVTVHLVLGRTARCG